MKLRHPVACVIRSALFLAGAITVFQHSVAGELRASAILPGVLLSSPNYKIREAVRNDDIINTYELETQQGVLTIESTPLLLVRTQELDALARIAALEGTDVFQRALKQGAKSPLKGAEALVENPLGTLKGAAKGVGHWLTDVGRSIASDNPHQAGVAETALGQAAAKRAFAYEFGVDPYTSNKSLQTKLDDIAWAAAGGGLTTKVAFALIPGAVGTVITATGTTEDMRALVRDKSPAQLDEINRKKLADMGVKPQVANAFRKNAAYTPQERTVLIGELDSLKDVLKDRARFVEAAAIADDEVKAIYMRFRAQMISSYLRDTRSKGSLVVADQTLLLKTSRGQLVVHLPVDHIADSTGFTAKLMSLNAAVGKLSGVSGKQVYLGGTVDPAVRTALEKTGWEVHEKEFVRMFKRS